MLRNSRFKIVFNYGFYGFLRIGLRQLWGRRLPIGTDGQAIFISFMVMGNRNYLILRYIRYNSSPKVAIFLRVQR